MTSIHKWREWMPKDKNYPRPLIYKVEIQNLDKFWITRRTLKEDMKLTKLPYQEKQKDKWFNIPIFKHC
jgi:hypothetical protein